MQANLIHLNDSSASDETDNDEANPHLSTITKATNKTIDDLRKLFIKQPNEKITCKLCSISSKVIHSFFH